MAYRAGSRLDRFLSYISVVSSSMPTWWLGIVMILVLAYNLRLFPQGGLTSVPPPDEPLARMLDTAYHLVLPVSTLVLVMVGPWSYSVRTMLINTAQEDFVLLAKAKGLSENRIMWLHVIRAAAPAILTSVILGLAGSLSGAILTETVFDLPGMGRLYYEAILAVDEPLIVALTYLFTLIYVIARFVLEVLYLVLDPRVRY
jgi:peptide/nickel transport system permease protein